MGKKIVIKMSGEALAGNSAGHFDNRVIEKIISQIKEIKNKGIQISMIVGGGNIWRGREVGSDMNRCIADQMGMMATVMNSLYIQDSFRQAGVDSVIMTPFVVGAMTELFSVKGALSHLESGRVLIFAGGTGHPFFSTDTIASIRAAELEADIILFAKSIDGVYDSNPDNNKNAVKLDTIRCRELIERNLGVMDIVAAQICLEQKKEFLVFGLDEENSILKAAQGSKIGTLVTI